MNFAFLLVAYASIFTFIMGYALAHLLEIMEIFISPLASFLLIFLPTSKVAIFLIPIGMLIVFLVFVVCVFLAYIVLVGIIKFFGQIKNILRRMFLCKQQ
jgi:hypothetical protein